MIMINLSMMSYVTFFLMSMPSNSIQQLIHSSVKLLMVLDKCVRGTVLSMYHLSNTSWRHLDYEPFHGEGMYEVP